MAIAEIHWASQGAIPILGLLQIFPLVSAALLYRIRGNERAPKLGLLLAAIQILFALYLFFQFDSHLAEMQFAERIPLPGPLSYHVAVDGISVLFMLVTAILMLAMLLYSQIRKLDNGILFMMLTLVIGAALQGIFATQNLFWFFLLSAVELVLVGYLLKHWANTLREDLAMQRYMQFMGTGLVFLLLGTFALGWNHAEVHGFWSFDLGDLVGTPIPPVMQSVIFFLLFYGLAIRTPFFPLHGWLPIISEHGTIAIAGVILLGLKVGIYGLVRFVFPILPEAVSHWQQYVVGFAVVGVFYAAMLALVQTNLRRLLAFAVVSHTGLVVIGLFSLHPLAFQGGLLLSVNFGLAISLLLFTSGMVYNRAGTLQLDKLGGLFDHISFIGLGFFLGGLSIIGMPGTRGLMECIWCLKPRSTGLAH